MTADTTTSFGAVIYVRVSDESQASGYSLSTQKRVARMHAHELGAAFTKVFIEPGHTATTMRRPELDAAIERAKEDDIKWFIVHKVNRFARNAVDGLNIEKELNTHGVELVSVAEQWDDTPAGKLMKFMYFGLAEMYSAELSEEVTTKMAEKARSGGTPGRCPPGYLNVRRDLDGVPNVAQVVIDEQRAPHITWAFEEFAKGDHTVATLHEAVTDRGLTTRPTRKHPERPVSKSTLHSLLRNPYYIGIVRWGGKQYQGSHPKLTDPETFERVQEVLDGNNTGGNKAWRYQNYLKNILRCGYCGKRMGFMHGRGQGGTYEYFYCRGRQQKVDRCVQRYMPVAVIEAEVERYYGVVQDKIDERLPQLTASFEKLLASHDQQAEAEARRQRARVAKLEREQKKLLQLAYDDGISDKLVKEELRRIGLAIGQAEKALEATKIGIGNLRERFTQFQQVMERAGLAYLSAPDSIRRVHNKFWFEWLKIKDGRIVEGKFNELPSAVLEEPSAGLEAKTTKVFTRETDDYDWDGLIGEIQRSEPDSRHVTGSIVIDLVDRTGLEPVTSRV